MCFEIHPDHAEVKIATEDITCYKVLRKINRRLLSPHQGERYFKKWSIKLFTIKKVSEFGRKIPTCNKYIYEGLHSYSEYSQATMNSNTNYRSVHKAIIPKGTEYYYNPYDNEYVSLKLKVFRKPMLHS